MSRELLQQALDALIGSVGFGIDDAEKIGKARRDIKAELEKPDTVKDDNIIEKLNQPIRTDVINGITLEYDILGGIDIKNDDFVFARVFYDHRYTHNAARKELAEQIAKLISGDDKSIAKPKPEPVAWMNKSDFENNECMCPAVAKYSGSSDATIPLYTSPPQRKPLSDDDIDDIARPFSGIGGVEDYRSFARAIENARGIDE